MIQLHHGDCLEVLKSLPDNSIDSIVTDPPYGLAFMNKKWDYDVPSVDIWKECLRVLKPGGHLLSFGGTRTYHRMVVNMEDAGFEIRDQIQWLYGSGFPKSLNISKAMDKAAGAERQKGFRPIAYADSDCWGVPNSTAGKIKTHGVVYNERESLENQPGMIQTDYPATDLAKQWDGWGTALKPSNEPICLARKPISESTVAANVVKWGCGGINVDATRITSEGGDDLFRARNNGADRSQLVGNFGVNKNSYTNTPPSGRWPANTLFDEEAAQMLDEQSGECKSRGAYKDKTQIDTGDSSMFGFGGVGSEDKNKYANQTGGASRFFYVAKASKRERDGSNHPTMKPIKLMQYLIKLITPPNGTVLDPFAGSGTTGVAAKQLNFNFIGIEREQEYLEIAQRRTA